jgi:hypothetical protein
MPPAYAANNWTKVQEECRPEIAYLARAAAFASTRQILQMRWRREEREGCSSKLPARSVSHSTLAALNPNQTHDFGYRFAWHTHCTNPLRAGMQFRKMKLGNESATADEPNETRRGH